MHELGLEVRHQAAEMVVWRAWSTLSKVPCWKVGSSSSIERIESAGRSLVGSDCRFEV
jgi:hypothetical protein